MISEIQAEAGKSFITKHFFRMQHWPFIAVTAKVSHQRW
jgi:hypothetical protein